MGSVEPIKSIFQFTLISLHTDFEFPSNQCEAGTPCTTAPRRSKADGQKNLDFSIASWGKLGIQTLHDTNL